MAERRVQAVPLVVEAVVGIELVTVFHPHPAAAGQHQVGREADPGPGHLPYRVGGLDVPGQIAVVVADRPDDLPTAFGHGAERGAEHLVLPQDLRRVGLREAEQLDDVAGEDHRDRARLRGQAAGQDLARAPRHVRPLRRQVQVADGEHRGAGRHRDIEQVGDVGFGGGHDRSILP